MVWIRLGIREWRQIPRHFLVRKEPACCSCDFSKQYHTIHVKNKVQQASYSLNIVENYLRLTSLPQNDLALPIAHYTKMKHKRDSCSFSQGWIGDRRYLHTSSFFFDKSKVEDSLKEKIKQKELPATDPINVTSEKNSDVSQKPKAQITTQPKKTIWQRFKAECMHYYHGFRLLFLDIRIASKTLWKILRGKTMTRREGNQFKRAVSDIFRLAPFSIFIIIPFAELALPIVVRIFPRLLPSTFEDQSTRDTRLKTELTVKLKMAKFMQDTVEEIAMRSKKSSKSNQATEDFANFFQKIRTTDVEPTNEEILKHAKLFEDELTLDSMTRPQLIALCRLIQVPAVGSNNLLRFLLQLKLKRLHADDAIIQREGINQLTVQELQTACQARGMRALGMSTERLKQQLQQWIDLHLNHDVPSSLLLLSRVLFMPENVPVEKMVKEAISSLPDKVADEAEVRAAELNCERIDNTKRYKITKQEQLDIAKEEAEEKKIDRAKKIQERKRKEEEEITSVESATQPASMHDTIEISQNADIAPTLSERTYVTSETTEMRSEGPVLVDNAQVMKEEITKEEIDVLDKAIDSIKKEDSFKKAKSELEDLKEDVVEYQQDVKSLDESLASDKDEILNKEKKASSRLQNRIKKFIAEMDGIVNELERSKEVSNFETDEQESISVEELKTTLRALGDISEEKLHNIAHVLDANKDGNIDLEEALMAIKALDSEDVSITGDQLRHLICMAQNNKVEYKTE